MNKALSLLLGATLVSFFFLTSSYSSAAPITVSGSSLVTASASASVTVASACTLSSTVGSEHSATIPAGTYKSEIGATTFNVVCNDTEGYSIYAIGYSNNEFGNNKLLANINGTPVSSANIDTGTNTSGNPSSWAMKLTPGTGLAASNISNGYDSYSIIPNQYTKVASLTPATNPSTNNTTSLEATYAVNIARAQSAGTYDGKVKYTMVHPATSIPNEPRDCNQNAICYWPNAEGTVIDSMGDQTISAIVTSATLWPTNFQRPGYGFAGWSDKFDWELNSNDENGNGTGNNAGYHIYGPMATINFTAGQYSGTNNGLSLYAVWVKSTGILQNWNGCSAMSTGEVTALTDSRDNNTYAVAKLADSKCWMIENLRLDNTAELTATNTDNPSLPLTNVYGGATSNYLSATNNTWCTSSNAACFDQSMLNTNNTASPVDNMTTPTDANIYSYGNYYNWYSVTAGNGRYATSSGNAAGSICPIGWRLPTGNTSGDFYALNTAVNSGPTSTSTGLRAFPVNFVYSGHYYGSSAHNRGAYGNYQSSTSQYSQRYYLTFSGDYVNPGTTLGNWSNKFYGSPIRCLVGS